MQLTALQAFVTIHECGSFSEAARRLHLTQPAISKRIATLEVELGHALFDRVGRRVSLTEAGQTYLPHARRLLADAADGLRALDRLSGQVTGRLGLALSHHVALHRMRPVLREFMQRYPQVEVAIEFLGSEDACRAIRSGRLELAVITLPEPPVAQLEQREIWPDPLSVVVSRDHSLAGVRDLTVHQLLAYPALLPEADTYTHRIIAATLGQPNGLPDTRLQSNYLESLKMLVQTGFGWSALPDTMLDDSLVRLSLPNVQIKRSLGSVHHPGRVLSSAAEALLAALIQASSISELSRG